MKHQINRITSALSVYGDSGGGGCDGLDWTIEWFDEIDSTNEYLIGMRDIDRRVCIAEQQTAGRGRRGRQWEAKKSGSVLMSMGWGVSGKNWAGLSLVSGLAVMRALQCVGVKNAGLKWPNDVLVEDKKICGILVEMSAGKCVIGVGINIDLGEHPDFTADRPWTDLTRLGLSVDRDQLAAAVLYYHGVMVERCLNDGFSNFVADWNAVHVYQDKMVNIIQTDCSFSAMAKGVDEEGALIVEAEGENIHLTSAEVSIRPNWPD